MKLTKLLTALLLFTICASCSIPLDCLIYNNSGSAIEITRYSGNEVEYVQLIESGKTKLLNGWELALYTTKIAGKKYEFRADLPYPSHDYVSHEGIIFKNRMLKAQLEPNKKIYLLKTSQTFPLTVFSGQPEGYPVELKAIKE